MPDDPEIPLEARATSYDYSLPPGLIAQSPAAARDASRLMFVPETGAFGHFKFSDIGTLLRAGDLLVGNDARVLRARFHPKRREGGRAEVLLLHPAALPGAWQAMVRPGKRVRKGDVLALDDSAAIEIVDWADDGTRIVRFSGIDADGAMARYGMVPLPPYIHEPPSDADGRYQTVYARRDGSVAAPTAGLHFTEELLASLRVAGVGWTTITLDVGAGTFRPVSSEDVREHSMHAERYEIAEATADAIMRARAAGGRIIAIGTTSMRALESAVDDRGDIVPGERTTSIFIHPPYRFGAVDALVTNFHLPRSTLLMLIAAFAGRQRVLDAYAEAVRLRYRFYSFGDAMFLERTRA